MAGTAVAAYVSSMSRDWYRGWEAKHRASRERELQRARDEWRNNPNRTAARANRALKVMLVVAAVHFLPASILLLFLGSELPFGAAMQLCISALWLTGGAVAYVLDLPIPSYLDSA